MRERVGWGWIACVCIILLKNSEENDEITFNMLIIKLYHLFCFDKYTIIHEFTCKIDGTRDYLFSSMQISWLLKRQRQPVANGSLYQSPALAEF